MTIQEGEIEDDPDQTFHGCFGEFGRSQSVRQQKVDNGDGSQFEVRVSGLAHPRSGQR